MDSETHNEQIECIQRQTDLNREDILKLLDRFSNDTEKVIRYYLSGGTNTEEYTYSISQDSESLNQRVFTEIRTFMDNIILDYKNKTVNRANEITKSIEPTEQ